MPVSAGFKSFPILGQSVFAFSARICVSHANQTSPSRTLDTRVLGTMRNCKREGHLELNKSKNSNLADKQVYATKATARPRRLAEAMQRTSLSRSSIRALRTKP